MLKKIGYTGSKQYEAKYLHFEKNFNDVDPMETDEKELKKHLFNCSLEGNTQKERCLLRYLQFDNTVLTF